MRAYEQSIVLSVSVIAGCNVVMLNMDLPENKARELLGFSIFREYEGRREWLTGFRTFEETDLGLPAGSKVSSEFFPFQDFSWSDYGAISDTTYTYTIIARGGTPENLVTIDEVSVKIKTEKNKNEMHSIYFNRGVAASQAYVRRFGYRSPEKVGAAAYKWLSRGAMESIIEFIEEAKDSRFSLHVCAYEFRESSVLKSIAEATKRDVKVGIIYDATKDFPATDNSDSAKAAGIKKKFIKERMTSPKAISHNKFIVLAKDGKAKAVLTGSTNFSEGGIYGQSNVVHICRDKKVSTSYLNVWKILNEEPEIATKDLSKSLDQYSFEPDESQQPITKIVFSPRSTTDALGYYSDLVKKANTAVFATFAFGMNEEFRNAFKVSKAPLRYVSLEKLFQVTRNKEKNIIVGEEMIALRKMKANRFAVGSMLKADIFDKWLKERLSGLNTHVKYIHTKFMLIDPLSDFPIVITGSANFSENSSTKNDENMLIIYGDSRVADIYLGEFMRIWEHSAFREWANSKLADQLLDEPWWLVADSSWTKRFYGKGAQSNHRAYFITAGQ